VSAAPAPQHLDDLKKSGLSDTTIEALQFASIRPHDLKLKGVESAYAIPYFNPDGSANGFQRRKLFPPITTSGGTMRYWQPPNTSPHLYLPPLLSWQSVAKHATTELTITEGEKKAACACQRGLITAGVGGVWCWTSTLDNGDKLILPILDEFQWTNRPVLLCPDSDGWHDGKGMQILAGFFALAKELQQRGASVQFVRLPDIHGTKAGLDDWLLIPGNDVEQAWPKLERLSLEDPRFHALNSWWQTWKEKQATRSAIQHHDVDDLELTETAGFYTVTCAKHTVRFAFDRLTDARGGVYAEMTVILGATELLSGVDLGLKSDSGQTKLAFGLTRLASTVPWKLLLQKACSLVLKRHRHGEPVIRLEPSASACVPFILNPIIYQQHQTLIFAPGGTCKSYLALWFALLTCHGADHAGVAGVKANVLYLDWELNAETVGGRLKALQSSHPELSHVRPYYRRCELPLHQEAHQIAHEVAQKQIRLVIVDSAAMACGGELSSPDAAITLQRALRKIGCASLVLAHTSKSVQEGQERTAFGTVFFRELARNVWELTKADDENPVKLALSQPKNNFGPKHPTLGFSLSFAGEQVRVDAQDLTAEPEFQIKLPTPARIRNLLEDGKLRTSQEIAAELNKPLASIQATLSNKHYKGIKWQMIGENRDAQWTILTLKTNP
jgi:hypothetical protein